MNRKARKYRHNENNFSINSAVAEDPGNALAIADWMAQANWRHRQGEREKAQEFCERILARQPSHVPALNLLGLVFQASGRHKPAVKMLAKAIAADQLNAACHYNIASSYQALDRADEAAAHFKKAIALGMSEKPIENFILQNPVIATWLHRIEKQWPLPVMIDGPSSLATVANDVFLRCALETVPIRYVPLERFHTFLRSALLGLTYASVMGSGIIDDAIARLFIAVAQQCFLNEYVFDQRDEETRQSNRLKELLQQKLADGAEIPPLLLAAVAAYFPLHSLAIAQDLLRQNWPDAANGLVRQQLSEPLEEAEDIKSIQALTTVEDSVSLAVMHQYEENPYPRWSINPLAVVAGDRKMGIVHDFDDGRHAIAEILVAGCGTGQHAFQAAQIYPKAQVLAVDISKPSLAYARRKTREEGLRNIEYARADILKLGAIGRSFDRVEAVGVLHHLAEPELGWCILLSLLRPNGEMRIGLYSEVARRSVGEARAFIAERGYRPAPEEIRKCRQDILHDSVKRGWEFIIECSDFYSMSGCRDMLFNVMEHGFTVPKIKTFLREQRLSFLGFELEPRILEKFTGQFPGAAALTDLDNWHAFETANPQIFRAMYIFKVRKN
jgi:SAM-dependent methyltransferase